MLYKASLDVVAQCDYHKNEDRIYPNQNSNMASHSHRNVGNESRDNNSRYATRSQKITKTDIKQKIKPI